MFFTNGTYLPASPATAYTISCDPSANIALTLTLVWTDPPGNVNSQKQLVNDLDLIDAQDQGMVYGDGAVAPEEQPLSLLDSNRYGF